MLIETGTGIRDSNGTGLVFLEVLCDQEVMVRLHDLHAKIIKGVLESGYTPVHDHPNHLIFNKPSEMVKLVYHLVSDMVMINAKNTEMLGQAEDCVTVSLNHTPGMVGGGIYSFGFNLKSGRRYCVWFRMNIQNVLRPTVDKQPWWRRLWTWVK